MAMSTSQPVPPDLVGHDESADRVFFGPRNDQQDARLRLRGLDLASRRAGSAPRERPSARTVSCRRAVTIVTSAKLISSSIQRCPALRATSGRTTSMMSSPKCHPGACGRDGSTEAPAGPTGTHRQQQPEPRLARNWRAAAFFPSTGSISPVPRGASPQRRAHRRGRWLWFVRSAVMSVHRDPCTSNGWGRHAG
jgi:hypothetical protein